MPIADQHCLTMSREEWCASGALMALRRLLCSACCPSTLTLDLLSPEFMRIHLCFALAAKHLPRAEDPERCWVWDRSEGKLLLLLSHCEVCCIPRKSSGTWLSPLPWPPWGFRTIPNLFPCEHWPSFLWETSLQVQLFLSKMREHPSSARQYKLPPQALWLWHPTLIYHHRDPQHEPASLSRAATSSASASAHSPRSWLPTSPPLRRTAEPGKSWHSLFSLLQLPVHKGAPAGTQTLEHVAGTHVPLGGMAVMALCRVWLVMGVEQGCVLLGWGKKGGTWGAAQWWCGSEDWGSDSLPSTSPLFSFCPSPNLPLISFHTVLFTPSSLQGNSYPRSKEECLALDTVRIITVLLLKPWLWVLKSTIHHPWLPTDCFCHHPPHLSCKCWWQNSNPKTWYTSHALPIFPFTAWSWLCISAPCQRSRGKFASTHLQDKSYSFLLPFHLLSKPSPLTPPVSEMRIKGSPWVLSSKSCCKQKHIWLWFPLGRLQTVAVLPWLCYLSQLPLCLCLLPAHPWPLRYWCSFPLPAPHTTASWSERGRGGMTYCGVRR